MLQKINQISWCGNPIDPVYVNPNEIVSIRQLTTSEKPNPFYEIKLRNGSIIQTYDLPDVPMIGSDRCEYCGSYKGINGCPKCGAP